MSSVLREKKKEEEFQPCRTLRLDDLIQIYPSVSQAESYAGGKINPLARQNPLTHFYPLSCKNGVCTELNEDIWK